MTLSKDNPFRVDIVPSDDPGGYGKIFLHMYGLYHVIPFDHKDDWDIVKNEVIDRLQGYLEELRPMKDKR